jgi:hypothetical protein
MAPKLIRHARVVGNIAYIPLTKGHEAIVDVCDLHLVDKWNWYAKVDGNTLYAYRNDRSGARARSALMHREILQPKHGELTDHVNGNGLDNRRENLRIATKSQNGANSKPNKRNKAGYKGVHFNSRENRWAARIKHNKKLFSLGLFETAEQAASAYREASVNLFKDFSYYARSSQTTAREAPQ